ncbi:TetR/AcrR family transcriptional regulator [Lacticaseibacillus yichunensis]|uniref:TetR/AcrR family transcriptional regulator n=1 Tax=Lacticaseibacillus yichunensis TaxID=2486015 RepID=A0ABW4CML8_9LACO|nr:TetR/AcrR family transcriptional regulator [Lacticaseibacillus yichunensis]
MVGTKNNRRTAYTKAKLQEALLSLLADKPLEKITVSALCAQADVNRGTFYAHYSDPAALFKAMETELAARIAPMLGPAQGDLREWLPPILELLRQQRAATVLIIRNLEESPVLQLILDPIREQTMATYRARFNESDPQKLTYYFQFFLNGSVRVITSWLKNGAVESPAAIADILANITQQVLAQD